MVLAKFGAKFILVIARFAVFIYPLAVLFTAGYFVLESPMSSSDDFVRVVLNRICDPRDIKSRGKIMWAEPRSQLV